MVERDDICPFCGNACGHWAAALAEIKIQTDAADAAAEAVGAMAEKLSATLAERDRQRAVMEEYERAATDGALNALGVDEPLTGVVAERDRLRDALRLVYFHLGPPQPQLDDEAEVPALAEKAMAERDRLRAEKAHLVEVNAALRTRPDLAERAPLVLALVDERNQARSEVAAYGATVIRARVRVDEALGESPAGTLLDALEALIAERDRLRAAVENLRAVVQDYEDEMSHIGFAVANGRGAVHHDDILGLVRETADERDRLRARRAWLRHAYAECNIERRAALSSLDSTQAHLLEADRKRHNAEAGRDRLRAVVAEYQRTLHQLDADLEDDHVDSVGPQCRDWKKAQTALLELPTADAEDGT